MQPVFSIFFTMVLYLPHCIFFYN